MQKLIAKIQKKKLNEWNSAFVIFQRWRAEIGFKSIDKGKIKTLRQPERRKNPFRAVEKMVKRKKNDFDIALSSIFFAVKELAEKKNIKKQFFNFKKDKNLKQFVNLQQFLAVGL